MGSALQKIIRALPFSLVLFAQVSLYPAAHSSPENDRVYQLETLGLLRATDNVDGIFGDYLQEQFDRYFSKQNRFVLKPLKGLDSVFQDSQLKPHELVQQAQILKKISQKYKVENLLRSRVYKESDTYRFVFEWVYAPRGDVLAIEEFRFVDPGKQDGLMGSDLPLAIEKGLDSLIQKLPFLGQITGVDGDVITVNMGHLQNIKPKDTITIYTIQSVKRHPILKTIEEWRWQPVGRAVVEQVDDSLSFAKITEVEPGHNVIRFQKIKEIIPQAAQTVKVQRPIDLDETPRIGWLAGNIGIGNYSRDVGLPAGISGRSGGGLLQTFEVESQIWLNSRFLAQGSLQANIFKYAPKDLATGSDLSTSYNGSGTQLRLALGYALFEMKTVYDSIAWVHTGYKSTSYALPTSTTDFTANSTFGSLFLGVGGEMSIQPKIGAQMGIDLGLLRSASSTGLSFGSASSTTDLGFNLAGIYRFNKTLMFRVLFELNSQSMDFTAGHTVSQKVFSISPSVMYYF